MGRKRMTFGLAAVLAAAAGSVTASEGPTTICYSRSYDAAHMKQHPGQKVAAINIIVAYRAVEGGQSFHFKVTAKLADAAGPMSVSGFCGFRDPDGLEVNMPDASMLGKDSLDELIACTADADVDGAMTLQRRAKGATAVLKLEDHFVLHGTCGQKPCDADLMKHADDKVFLLNQADAATCAELERAMK